MNRRAFVTGLSAVLAAPLAVEAQPATKAVKIGYLSNRSGPSHLEEAFQQGLRELGFVEGRDIIVEYRWANGIMKQLPDLAADLVRLNVRLIVAPSK